MRVAVLNDLPVAGTGTSGFGSGAELSIGRFVREGHTRGHQVDVINPEFCKAHLLAEYDVVLPKNVTAFPHEVLTELATLPNGYITWPSDYAWTKWRLYFAFQEEQRRIPSLPFWRDFFLKSKVNVFLSPLHRQAYEWVMPELVGHASLLSPPTVDTTVGPAKDGWVPNTGCTVNGLLEFKGLHSTLKWMEDHKDVQFTSVGSIRENVNLPANVKHVGYLPRRQFAEVLGRSEVYIELPRSVQPFNQTCVQALLACKRVVTNELMGAASYPWFRNGNRAEVAQAMRDAMPNLWQRLEQEATA